MRHATTEVHGSTGVAGPHAAMAGATGVLADATTATASAMETALVGDVAEPGDLHAAMGLCLAILAGAVFLAARRAGLSSYPLASVLATDTAPRLLPSRARAPDPPDLHALSIQRC